MNTLRSLGIVLALAGAGCATVSPPAELVRARSAYERAQQGPAARLDPADLHSAKQTLNRAEASFDSEGDTLETRDLAYSAERSIEIAEARARTRLAAREKEQTVGEIRAAEYAAMQFSTEALGRAKQHIADQGQQLQGERERRVEAEKRAARAYADLAKLGAVKQEARGVVLTLSGSVLFVSGKAELLPAAQVKLNEVAEVLSNEDTDSTIVVEGHTDSQGTQALNQELSQRRAESVRAYLVSKGIAGDRIKAEGFGPARPVADNRSAEGRANNRRVEIVMRPPAN